MTFLSGGGTENYWVCCLDTLTLHRSEVFIYISYSTMHLRQFHFKRPTGQFSESDFLLAGSSEIEWCMTYVEEQACQAVFTKDRKHDGLTHRDNLWGVVDRRLPSSLNRPVLHAPSMFSDANSVVVSLD